MKERLLSRIASACNKASSRLLDLSGLSLQRCVQYTTCQNCNAGQSRLRTLSWRRQGEDKMLMTGFVLWYCSTSFCPLAAIIWWLVDTNWTSLLEGNNGIITRVLCILRHSVLLSGWIGHHRSIWLELGENPRLKSVDKRIVAKYQTNNCTTTGFGKTWKIDYSSMIR